MSTSTPEAPVSPSSEPVAPEPSSLGRWLVIALVMVGLGVGLTFAVRFLARDKMTGLSSFPIVSKPKGPPGKGVLSEEPVYNFGVMPQQQTGKHTWILENKGPGELLLTRGPSTCSCTIANFSEDKPNYTLPPGEKTEITLTWETRESDGTYEKSATVNTLNDPERESIQFVVKGTVRPAIAVEPKERVLNFGAVPSDTSQTARFAMSSADRPDFKILSITNTHPDYLATEIVPLPDADRRALNWEAMKGGYLVNVTLKPSPDIGLFNDEITVTTDHPHLKEIKLTAGGRRLGPISMTPDVVRMHNVNSEEGGSFTMVLLVRNAPETTFQVAQAPDNLKVEIVPADVKTGSAAKIRQYRMTVTVPPGTEAGVIDGFIVLKSDHPGASQVRVPVDISVIESN